VSYGGAHTKRLDHWWLTLRDCAEHARRTDEGKRNQGAHRGAVQPNTPLWTYSARNSYTETTESTDGREDCECERHPHFEGFTRLILFLLQLGTTDHSCCTRQIRRFGLRGWINEDVKNSEKRIGIFSRRRFSRTRCTSLLMILLPFLQLSAVAIPYSRGVSRTRPARRSSVR
jgi:hypothetical protein